MFAWAPFSLLTSESFNRNYFTLYLVITNYSGSAHGGGDGDGGISGDGGGSDL